MALMICAASDTSGAFVHWRDTYCGLTPDYCSETTCRGMFIPVVLAATAA